MGKRGLEMAWRRAVCLLAGAGLLLGAPARAQEADIVAEAEQGVLLGGARVGRKGATAYVEGFSGEDDGVQLMLSAPHDGFYDLVFRSCGIGGHKENYVDVDGERAGVLASEGGDFAESRVEYLYLTKGEHTVTIRSYWGWIRLDSVALVASQALPDDLYDVEPTLTDADATDSARRLMAYLCDIYGKFILTGQYCDGGMYGNENACIWRATGGEYPAVLGMDMMEYTPSRVANGAAGKTVERAIEYWEKQGGIVTLCWHWTAPEPYITGRWYSAFYTDHTNIDLARIMAGEDEQGYELLLRDIDAIAVQLKRLQDAGVPILWRPLHEASGGWFWWGNAGSEAYIQLYRLMYDRLTNTHGLHNLIWVWNGQHADWYPGDDVVDIIGEDIYAGERVYGSQAARFLAASRYTDQRKLIVLSENGCVPDPDLMLRDGVMWGFYATWGGEFVARGSNSNRLSETYTEASMIQKVYSHPACINRGELPDIRTYPLH